MGTIVREARLFYTHGSSDKEYRVVLSEEATGYIVYGLNGRRGAARTRQSKTASPVSLASADAVFETVFAEKAHKGYTTLVSGAPHAGATLPPRSTTMRSANAPWVWTSGALPADEARFEALLAGTGFVLQWAALGNPAAVLLAVRTAVDQDMRLVPEPARTELAALRPACVFGIVRGDGDFVVFDAIAPLAKHDAGPALSERLRQAHARLCEEPAQHVVLAPWAAGDETSQFYALFEPPSGAQAWLFRPDLPAAPDSKQPVTVFSAPPA
jgi:hypothetical protein